MSSLVSRVSAASQRLVLRVMSSSLNLLRQFEGARDVAILVSFVAAAEQDDNPVAAPDEIHPIAGAVVNPHLRHAAALRLPSPGLPSERRRMRTVIRARASRSRSPAKPIRRKASVCRTSSIAIVSYKGQVVKFTPLSMCSGYGREAGASRPVDAEHRPGSGAPLAAFTSSRSAYPDPEKRQATWASSWSLR